MRLLVFTDGDYGLRILENIRLRGPRDWEITNVPLPESLPSIVEEPDLLVDGLVPEGAWDLILFMGESPSAFTLLPSIAARSSSKAVVAPVDDYSWLPLGLERQVRSELDGLGVASVFPRTFCTLSPVGVAPIDEFAEVFGLPLLKLEVEEGRVKSVDVLRGAPCGSTWFMAETCGCRRGRGWGEGRDLRPDLSLSGVTACRAPPGRSPHPCGGAHSREGCEEGPERGCLNTFWSAVVR